MNALPLRRRLALELFNTAIRKPRNISSRTFWNTLRFVTACIAVAIACATAKPDMPAGFFGERARRTRGTVDLKTFIVITGGEPLMPRTWKTSARNSRRRGGPVGDGHERIRIDGDTFRAFRAWGCCSILVSLGGLRRSRYVPRTRGNLTDRAERDKPCGHMRPV